MSLICLETSHSSSRPSGSDQQDDSIPFEMMDGHHSPHSGNVHSSFRSQHIPLYRCQSLWMGSSSRADETIRSKDQSQLHINILDMMAICLALKKAIKYIHHSCVMISTDNTTVVSYINKQGGTHTPILCEEVWKIHRWCLEHDILIGVHHIPGRFNKFFYWQTSFLDWTDLSKRMGF